MKDQAEIFSVSLSYAFKKSNFVYRKTNDSRAHRCVPLLSQKIGTMKITMQYFIDFLACIYEVFCDMTA